MDSQRGQGRPSGKDGPVVSREDLLAAAMQLIAVNGFDGTSVRGLAKEVGVTHGTVQHHFPTKDDLWRAIVDEVLVPELSELRETRDESAPVDARVGAILGARIRAAASRPGLPGTVLLDASEGGRERLAYLAAALEPFQSSRGGAMDAAASGRLRSVDPAALRALIGIGLPLLASAHEALRIMLGIDLDDAEQREAFADGLTDILLHGILPRGDTGPT